MFILAFWTHTDFKPVFFREAHFSLGLPYLCFNSKGSSNHWLAGLLVTKKKACDEVVLSKSVEAIPDTTEVDFKLTTEDTRIGEVINKPVDYWYEIELNPDTYPQTLIGYDEDGPKIFRLYPEGVKELWAI